MRLAAHERTFGETRIGQRVRHDQRLGAHDRVRAERDVARRLRRRDALPRLEPLPILIDQGDDRHRHLQHGLDQARDALECLFRPRIEDLVAMQRGDPRALAAGVA